MARKEFRLPDVGEGVAEGELVQWLVAPGDTVSEDQPVAEVETDKALVEIPSPYDGTVEELLAEAGEMVPVGEVIIAFDVPEGELDSEEAEETATEAESAAKAEEAKAAPSATGRVFAPPSVRRLARELGVALDSVEGSGPSGRITESDVRATAAEPEAAPEPRSITSSGEQAVTRRESTDEAVEAVGRVAEERSSEREAAEREQTLATPATRRVAEELGVDVDAVPTEETRDGEPFVTTEMIREYASAGGAAEEGAEAEAVPEKEAEAGAEAEAETAVSAGERVPYRGVRRTIGEHMAQSKATVPHATHHDDVDVTELVSLRERLADVAAEEEVKLTYTPFVMKAVAVALQEFPYMNASLDEDADEIVLHEEYNVGVATATDAGLMVPVVESVDEKRLLDVAAEMRDKVSRARDRAIARDEMQGGTFTVTNIGVIGGEYATPIVNHPEVGILALGEIRKRPRVVDDEVVPRHTLPLSLSIDHRVVDGAVAAEFTNRVKELLSAPERLLLE